MDRYTIMVGGLRPEDCHTEFEVAGVRQAVAHLYAFALKSHPDQAIANIGDHRGWIGNADMGALSTGELHSLVWQLVAEEDAKDEAAERRDNTFLPDIRIEPTAEGQARVSSVAMQFDSHVDFAGLQDLVKLLVSEYQDLVDGGLVSRPVY